MQENYILMLKCYNSEIDIFHIGEDSYKMLRLLDKFISKISKIREHFVDYFELTKNNFSGDKMD